MEQVSHAAHGRISTQSQRIELYGLQEDVDDGYGWTLANLLLLGAILSFVPLGITLIVLPWNNLFHLRSSNNQITYFLAYVICICLVTMLWVTTLSAVMTFDDIFKTVAGMYQAGTTFRIQVNRLRRSRPKNVVL